MTTEEQVLSLLREANPVPDVDSLDLETIGGAPHLRNLEPRSRDMADTEIKATDRTERHQKTRWLAAAVIVLVAGLALVLLSQVGTETADTTPTSVAEPSPTTAQSAPTTDTVVTTTIDAAEAAWQELPVLAGPNPLPRTYRTAVFQPAFSLEISAGWRPAPPETRGEFTLTNSTEFNRAEGVEPDNGIYFRDFGFGSVEETIEGFNTGFAAINLTVTPIGSTSIGGAEGQLLEIAPRSQTIQCCDEGTTMLFHQAKTYLAHIVDVNGTGVAVIVQAPTETFETFQERAQEILDSIVWKDLG